MSSPKPIWLNPQPQQLYLLLRRYIGWVASSLILALLLYIPANLLPITPNLFNLWLAISILLIQPVLHQLSKKVLRIKVINISDGQPAGPIRSFLRNLLFFIPPFNLIDCLTMLLNGRRLSEWATDTKVVTVSDIFQKSEVTKKSRSSLLLLCKGLILLASLIIFLNFYYQIIVSGIVDMKSIQNDLQRADMSEEGIQILHLKGIVSLGLLGREFDHRNKYQKLIDELNQREYNEIQLKKLYKKISVKKYSKILELLEDQKLHVKNQFCRLLKNLNDQQALIKLLNYKDIENRRYAASALGAIGPEAKQAIPVLIGVLNDQDAVVRQNAAWALGAIGPEAKQTIPALIEVLDDEYEYEKVRQSAALALGAIGPEAKQVIPVLK